MIFLNKSYLKLTKQVFLIFFILVSFASLGFSEIITEIVTVNGATLKLPLYTKEKEGNQYKRSAIIKVKGAIGIGSEGIVSGKETFLSLQVLGGSEQWKDIVKRELVKGRLVITTEDHKVYTIYDLDGNYYNGKIKDGKFTK